MIILIQNQNLNSNFNTKSYCQNKTVQLLALQCTVTFDFCLTGIYFFGVTRLGWVSCVQSRGGQINDYSCDFHDFSN